MQKIKNHNYLSTLRIVLFLLLLMNTKLLCQLPDILLTSPVFIEHKNGTGTGFLISDSTNLYFVTARHIFMDPTKKKSNILSVKEAKLTLYAEDPVTGEKTVYKINLEAALSSGLIMASPKEDVLIIKIAELEGAEGDKVAVKYYKKVVQKLTKSVFLNFIPISVLEKYEDVNVGDEIFLLGYPASIGLKMSPQFDYSRPLLRRGIIAGKYDPRKSLILDCPTYPGNSGGPVIVKIVKIVKNITITEYKLVGVVVEFIPYKEQWVNTRSMVVNIDIFNSGYSVAVSASRILELLSEK